ncbi:MAG TPA: alpha/beta hydrolase [Gaiellaceae bacterium]|nr:alpha/beta hydrolase [Gaiellaceae bacterium]
MRVVLDSGRRVAVHRTATRTAWHPSGDREEHVVVLCHSAPGAGSFDPDPTVTQARNVRLLSIDRPGYGRSDPVAAGQWATVAAAADDLAAVLDSLQVERVGVVGWSAGGRVALALGARRPDLVSRLVVVATPAPDDELPWIEAEEREALERLRDLSPDEAHASLCERLASVVPDDPFHADALWLVGAGPTDEPVLRSPGTRARLGRMLAAAFAEGARGLAADIAGYCLQPWGFEPAAVKADTLLLYGSHDPIAGPRHGRWWHEQLPAARLEVAPGAGHLLVIPMWARVLEHLVPGCPRLRAIDGSRNSQRDDDVEEFSAA